MAEQPESVRKYFVDEAGDGVIFNAKGRIIVGDEGCSRYFVLGLADISQPESLAQDMDGLRAHLLADPYFKGVPSMHIDSGKTAVAFHAKDDLPEVRREVFNLLLRHDMKFFAILQDKQRVVDYVRQRNERDSAYRYSPNEQYDYLVRGLFKQLLHKHDEYHISFAKRGSSSRTEALRNAIEMARQRFCEEAGIATCPVIDVRVTTPSVCAGLQAVDYFLWALQRLYERREDRYIQLIWPLVSLVRDPDDRRDAQYGVYYTQKKPLTLAAFENLPGI